MAACNAVLCIRSGARPLADFPEIGHPLDDGSARRERFTAFGAGAYVLRYRLEANQTPVAR